jgi:ABC-2 type transport system ATP-binding protein
MNHVVEMTGICQRYEHFQLDNVELKVESGSVMGLIGANGAGKSTILRILMGLILPDAGQVVVLGQTMPQAQTKVKLEIGYTSEDMRLYEKTTLAKHIEWMRSIYPTWDNKYCSELIERFRLIPTQHLKGFSHGQRVKAMLLLALSRRPKLLVLDEPTTGLDPIARNQINRELMRAMEDGDRSVILSSQNTQDVEQICDYITFIDDGRVIESADRDSYIDRWRRLRLEWSDTELPKIEGLLIEQASKFQATAVSDIYDEALRHRIEQAGVRVTSIERMTLEEIFVSTVNRELEVAS